MFSSRQALRLARQQEERRQPLLVPYLSEGYVKFEQDHTRLYAFLTSVSSRSDSDNSIAEIYLNLTYISAADASITVTLPSNSQLAAAFPGTSGSPLAIPTHVGAHQTVLGWCYFRADGNIVTSAKSIESHLIVFRDSHGIDATLRPIMIQEYARETLS